MIRKRVVALSGELYDQEQDYRRYLPKLVISRRGRQSVGSLFPLASKPQRHPFSPAKFIGVPCPWGKSLIRHAQRSPERIIFLPRPELELHWIQKTTQGSELLGSIGLTLKCPPQGDPSTPVILHADQLDQDTQRNMEAAPGHRKSCQPCRRRHLRCDRSTPTCSNCRKSKYPPQCDYDAADQLKFRTHVFGPPKSARNGQPDSHSSSNSERRKRSKPSVTSRVRQEQQSSSPVPGPNLVPGPEDAPVVPTPAAEPVSGSPLSSLSSDPGPPGGSPIEQPSMGSFAIFSPPRAPEQCFETDERPPQPSRVSNIDTLLSGLSQLSPPSQLPFTDSTEAMIFKYYLESAGPWVRTPPLRGLTLE